MALLLKNTSASAIQVNDIGATIAAGSTYDLSSVAPEVVAYSAIAGDVFIEVNGGNMVAVDPRDGLTDLSVADSLIALRGHNDSNYGLPPNSRIADALDIDLTGIADNKILKWATDKFVIGDAGTGSSFPPNSGRIVQVKFGTILSQSGTSSMPANGVPLPTITDGTEIWSNTITPTLTTSTIRVSTSAFLVGSTSSTNIAVVVYRGTIPVGVTAMIISKNNAGSGLQFTIYDDPGVDTEITYSCRVGKTTNGTWYVNSTSTLDVSALPLFEANGYSIEEIGIT